MKHDRKNCIVVVHEKDLKGYRKNPDGSHVIHTNMIMTIDLENQKIQKWAKHIVKPDFVTRMMQEPLCKCANCGLPFNGTRREIAETIVKTEGNYDIK